ncbi:MAG: tRNA uridine-5-carboxymethylaminomethyl(34) synthesis GTPase MnmE [Sphingomicrobium sp.]
MQDTIVALSSGRPPAAIAVIRTSGPAALVAAATLAGALPPPKQARLRTLRHPTSGLALDSVLLLRFDEPHSATGEDIVEFQCHGGRAVVAAILAALTSFPGVRNAEPGEFTRRALANGRIDLTEAEGLADLLEAETEQQRRAALALAGGALSRQVEIWQGRVLDLSARAEAAIDYVGDEDETAIDAAALRADARALAAELEEWLARPRAERLKDGVRVVVAGPPNAGKSSLINAMIGFNRSIVSDIAGTTRDSIEVPLSIDGIPFLLVDTAGLREAMDPVEALGIARAHDETARAEILLWLGEPGEAPAHPCLIPLEPKSDLRSPALPAAGAALPVSAFSGTNLDTLLRRLVQEAELLLPAEAEVPLNVRQAIAVTSAARDLGTLPDDLLLTAEQLRSARSAFDRLTGRAGIDEAIEGLFARFCLGK